MSKVHKILDELGKFITELNAKIDQLDKTEFDLSSVVEVLYQPTSKHLTFSDNSRAQFFSIRDSLVSLFPPGIISIAAIENVLISAIDTAMFPKAEQKGIAFKERLSISLKQLEQKLTSEPKSHKVFVPIEGFQDDISPFEFGNVSFCTYETGPSEEFNSVVESSASDKDRELNKRLIADFTSGYEGKILASTTVLAFDNEAAMTMAQKEIQLTIDVLNFIVGLIYRSMARLDSLNTFWPRSIENTIMLRTEGDKQVIASVGSKVSGPLRKVSSTDLRSYRAEQFGFRRLDEILKKQQRNGLEDRLLASVQWAGRASADQRSEEAFLFFTTALEALLAKLRSDVPITYRLKTRVSHLLGSNLSSRREVAKTISDLYGVRSAIVHGGRYEVRAEDLANIRFFSMQSIIVILDQEPFRSMTNEQEFEGWFEDQVLSTEKQL